MFSELLPLYFSVCPAPNASLRHGYVYAIAEDGVGSLDAMVAATLAAPMEERACLVAPRQRLDAIVQSAPPGLLDSRLAAGQICMLETAGERGMAPAQQLTRLADELAHFQLQGPALVLLDHAETLFGDDDQHNLALARQLRSWAERDNKILVLLLRRSSAEAADPLLAVRAVSPHFAGIARLRQMHALKLWQTFHWHHAEGLVSNMVQRLLCDADGKYSLAAPEAGLRELPADEEMTIMALRTVLLPDESAGAGWQMADDMAGLQELAAGSVSATLLLPFSQGVSFDTLARSVLSLRTACGRRVKIVVRETNLRMRQSQEALLLHLGASLVVPAGISLSRCLNMCTALQGQVFSHMLPASFEEAVAGTMPEQLQGYLPPAAFVDAVKASMKRSHENRIESSMVRLTLVKGLTPLDALRYCDLRRIGDLATADGTAVYLFLYACREADLQTALDGLFRLPVSELFIAESRYTTARDIDGLCKGLARSGIGAADLTEALSRAVKHAAPAPRVPAGPRNNNGPVPLRHAGAAPAARRALPVIRKLTVA